ncbi:MAG TPA: hypothetical protein VD963_00430 [Phycisphaerales bacterium]|nr:hypothetical protein [Phycisphaerales bacterium]
MRDRRMVRSAGRAILGSILVAAAGCGESDRHAEAIRDASVRLEALSAGGPTPVPFAGQRSETYRQVTAGLRPVVEGGLPGEKAAAGLLIARAQAGQGQIESEAAAGSVREILGLSGSVRSALNLWLSQQSVASSLAQHDPTPALDEMAARGREIDEQIAAAAERKRQADQRVRALEDQAEQALQGARAKRDQAAEVRERAQGTAAVERAALIEEAARVGREADALDAESARLRADARHQAPEAAHAQTDIDRLTLQKRLLGEAQAETRALAQLGQEQAASARAEADLAAAKLRELVTALDAARAAVPGLVQQATGTLRSAATTARQAGTVAEASQEIRSTAKLAEATYQHAVADVLANQLLGERAYRDTMAALAQAAPALPEAASYQTKLQDAAQACERLKAETTAAYEAAKAAFAAVSGRAEVKDRLERIAAALEQIQSRDETVPAPSDPADAAPSDPDRAGEADPAAAAGADDEAGIRATLGRLAEMSASGDATGLPDLLHAATPEEERLLGALTQIGAASSELNAACKEKFNATLAEALGGPEMMGQTASMIPQGLDPAAARITRNGPDAATVTLPAAPEPVKMVRVGAAWKVALDIAPEEAAMVAMMLPLMTRTAPVFTDLAARVRSGELATPADLRTAFQQRMAEVMGGAGGPGGGG